MTYLEWITKTERISMVEYMRMPEIRKSKIRANYLEYCETFEIAPQKVRV